MTSFNRIGTRWTGGDYRLLTEILRNEWGFNGLVICDFNTIPQYMIPPAAALILQRSRAPCGRTVTPPTRATRLC